VKQRHLLKPETTPERRIGAIFGAGSMLRGYDRTVHACSSSSSGEGRPESAVCGLPATARLSGGHQVGARTRRHASSDATTILTGLAPSASPAASARGRPTANGKWPAAKPIRDRLCIGYGTAFTIFDGAIKCHVRCDAVDMPTK